MLFWGHFPLFFVNITWGQLYTEEAVCLGAESSLHIWQFFTVHSIGLGSVDTPGEEIVEVSTLQCMSSWLSQGLNEDEGKKQNGCL